jgi:hypothetical protein
MMAVLIRKWRRFMVNSFEWAASPEALPGEILPQLATRGRRRRVLVDS